MIEFFPGQQLCRCTLLSRCGAGAYGEVWLAQDEIGGRVAIKIVSGGGRYSEREIAGLRNYRDCNHPNLLHIRHIEINRNYLIYTMDAADDLHHGQGNYLPDTLANRLQQFKRLDGDEITEMLTGLLAGLEELHRHNLVHRDIKPDNILWVNGRPTLADAGLITSAGAKSLVGTLGFLSPRLLAGKSCAEPEDDFYALSKVVYCALTGNPVEKYPSFPRELTLSGNADWNRFFSEMCDFPVSSAEAFRKRMQFAPEPASRRLRLWGGIGILLLLSLAVLVFFFRSRRETSAPNAPYAAKGKSGTAVEIRPLPEMDPAEAIQKWKKSSSPVLPILRAAGLYDTDHLKELLNAQWCSKSDFFRRIEKCEQNPRMTGFPRYRTDKKPSSLEKELSVICSDYKEADLGDMYDRQFYWQSREGDPLTIQRIMLAEDPIMQSAALDYLIFKKIDAVLVSGKLEDGDRKLLKTWIQLKSTHFP